MCLSRKLQIQIAAVVAINIISFLAFAQAPATPPAEAPAPAAAPAAPAAPPSGKIKIGGEDKLTIAKVADVDKGDNGCYLTLKSDKGAEYIELGKFEFCSRKPSLKGKKVELAYSMETVQAASCYGDPKCKKTEVVPLIISVKIVE